MTAKPLIGITGGSALAILSFALAPPALAGSGSEDLYTATRWGTPQKCTRANSASASFDYVEKNADRRAGRCVRMIGYLWGETLYDSEALARNKNADPDWHSVGLSVDMRRYPGLASVSLGHPVRVQVIGIMADCGSSNIPQYCHHIGGSIIYVATITHIR